MRKCLIYSLGLFLTLSSCLNDEFLERVPLDKLVEETTFVTHDNFKTYSWQFYEIFNIYRNYNNSEKEAANNMDFYDANSDNGFYGVKNNENSAAWDKGTVPSTDKIWTNSFKSIRAIHVMLDNVDGASQLTETQKLHWRSVGYFFKAYHYYKLMMRYGDLPWVDKALTETDVEVLYGERMPRVELAKKVLGLLEYARDNIGTNDGPNTISVNVVNALISRFGLAEGTWEKYHGLSAVTDYNVHLQASFDASTALMKAYPNIHGNYDEVFNSEDLSKVDGIILYYNHLSGLTDKGHNMSRYVRTASHNCEASADFVQSYLCADGKTIWNSKHFEQFANPGDISMYDEFKNRDRRLYYTVTPPYKVNTKTPTTGQMASDEFEYTADPKDREYIDFMESLITPSSGKYLPICQWQGNFVREIPHFTDARYNMGQGYVYAQGGYYLYKYYSKHANVSGFGISGVDAPLFRMGEVLVNHAEAAWELGKFDQAVANATINKLRERAFIAGMTVAGITGSFDPGRDVDVDPVLWEIRRERRVELVAEGFRSDDLHRWKKGKYLDQEQVGVYIRKSDLEDARHQGANASIAKFSLKLDRPGDEGRIRFFGKPSPGWLDKYYLSPLPIEEIVLNKNLGQNDGWPKTNQ